jgi:hypothetical protein
VKYVVDGPQPNARHEGTRRAISTACSFTTNVSAIRRPKLLLPIGFLPGPT